jgi:hypothetical protein
VTNIRKQSANVILDSRSDRVLLLLPCQLKLLCQLSLRQCIIIDHFRRSCTLLTVNQKQCVFLQHFDGSSSTVCLVNAWALAIERAKAACAV